METLINQWVRSFHSTSRNFSNEQWWWGISKKVQTNLYWRLASDNNETRRLEGDDLVMAWKMTDSKTLIWLNVKRPDNDLGDDIGSDPGITRGKVASF